MKKDTDIKWISCDEQLPDYCKFVLCLMKSNYAIVGGYINPDHTVSTLPDFHFEDYEGYKAIYWADVPEFPEDLDILV